ncbi:hypothetical protein BDY19DRAFT_988528 [Irpex rosettiformis]|uniref:Uncharacterized protein n=1 Tax=Irpex rosettiformis TaxID=378272 RepID=A0ACB8UKJ7_9APHY|nr:hypothetical protein BDY19DRAFT_988528 [Irpex rosettiformis]
MSLVPGPAGLSSDTLEQSPASPGRIGQEDNEHEQWSDAHDTLETDDERDVIEEITESQGDLTIRPPKVATTPDNLKTHDMHTPSPTASSIPQPQGMAPQGAEEGSVRSLPIVQVTEPSSPVTMNTRTVSEAPLASPATSLASTTNSSLDRRSTLRAQDTRASNRISGFFSYLIHRRDHPLPTTRESMTPPPSTPTAREDSRASSPLPSRPATPPPPLPAPALSDLGLSLSSITTPLSPSHFSSPPCSGAFLQPHYLLLCHAQGLDVLPLVSPPAPQPYSLIRRVPFKSVVVMEHRGVLVAIAGRRDGVRVYALEEVKRAVEWRVEMEVKREREKSRREEMKRSIPPNYDGKPAAEKSANGRVPSSMKSRSDRRASISAGPSATRAHSPSPARASPYTPPSIPPGPPPAYSPPSQPYANTLELDSPLPARARTTSVNDVLAGTVIRRMLDDSGHHGVKGAEDDWDSSDDEAIDVLAAPSGSQALDERTSAAGTIPPARIEGSSPPRTSTSSVGTARRRPANLDLSLTRANPPRTVVATTAPPSPTPTLLTLRQALIASPGNSLGVPTMPTLNTQLDTGSVDADDEEEVQPSSSTTPTRERISLAEALMESRLPDVSPAGTERPQDAVLLGSAGEEGNIGSPRTSGSFSATSRRSLRDSSTRRRRRWSVFDGIFQPGSPTVPGVPPVPEGVTNMHSNQPSVSSQSEMQQRQSGMLSRSQSTRMINSRGPSASNTISSIRPSTAPGQDHDSRSNVPLVDSTSRTPISPNTLQPRLAPTHSGSRFLPRIITNAFSPRHSDDRPGSPRNPESDGRKSFHAQSNAPAPAPKLEYVKLPGTKGSVMVKAVETAKKSFLAILCGENGEKVELFAGTYRTALGLSRTFILPDSPRSLELQLQGDDLVEVFLVFSQNVFGLEPATVRVREVRIGRAERRAARRRLREAQQAADSPPDGDTAVGDDDTTVNVTVGVAVAPPTPTQNEENHASPLSSPLPGTLHPADTPANPSTDIASAVTNTATSKDELLSLAAAHSSPYTTFQQLPFAPNFPLAAIADEYVIPPTYPSFLQYRSSYEPDAGGKAIDLSQIQFSPPGLPIPPITPPSQWYYRDPKGVMHGPWPESLMQQWYKDALLPPDLPVRREEEAEYTVLKDLRLQCVDPTRPFRSSPPPPPTAASSQAQLVPVVDPAKPLLPPISILSQPRHFGPPPLFFSSRGGHSTTIVDARGRSIMKGRFMWSSDEDEDNDLLINTRLGDVKRLEAFDVKDRSVLVALRQGGVEIVDFADALLLPADSSRTIFPHFHPPASSVNRRSAFIWRIGERTSSLSDSPPMPSLPPKLPSRFHGKKASLGPSKLQGREGSSVSGDVDSEHPRDEVFFIGRKDDDVYFCERRFGSFRILRLSPAQTAF